MFVLKSIRGVYICRPQCISLNRTLATATKLDVVDDLASARPFSELPKHSKWQLIRDFMPGGQFADVSTLEYGDAMRKRFGDIFLMSGIFGRPDTVWTFSTKDIESVFRNEGLFPIREGFDSLIYFRNKVRPDIYGEFKGLVAAQGEEWSKLRSISNPVLMQPRNIKMYIKPLSNINDEFITRIKEIRDPKTLEMPSNFEEEINRLIFESISLIAFNREMGIIRQQRNNPEALELWEINRSVFRYIYKLDMQPSMWKVVPTPAFNKMMKILNRSLDITKKFINEAAELAKEKHAKGIDAADLSIFEKVLNINEKFAVILAMDILFAGVDATAALYTAVLFCLSQNPDKQAKLREEVLRVMPTKDTLLDEERMKDMPYLRAVIKESIRYYPNGPGTMRTCSRDLTLSGYTIPKGTRVLTATQVLMKDESYYPKAYEFVPERWLRQAATQKKTDINPFTFLPFGYGPRMCIGKRIVDLEIETSLTKLIRNFYVEYNYDASKPFRSLFTMEAIVPLKFKLTDVEK